MIHNTTDLSTWNTCAFVVAHPDDEVLIAGTMRRLLKRGVQVHGIWCTSGDYFGKGAVREAELGRASDIPGLPEPCRHLLRVPDLGLIRELDSTAERLAELFVKLRPSAVFCNAFEGGHPDHDCVNFLTAEACLRADLRPELYEFPLYNGAGPAKYWYWQINRFPSRQDRGPGQAEGDLLYTRLDPDSIDCKYRMMRAYSSQWMYMVPARLASPRSWLAGKGEVYRQFFTDRDWTIPPHAGTLNYERSFSSWMKIRFTDFRDAVQKVKDLRGNRSGRGNEAARIVVINPQEEE